VTVREIFFGFSGRINRAKYWGYSLLAGFVYCLLIAVLIGVGINQGGKDNIPLIVVLIVLGVAVSILIIVVQVAIGVKRLHDRGKTGWWLFLYYFVPSAVQQPKVWEHPNLAPKVIAVAVMVAGFGIMIWSLIDLGCLRGTPGPNAYGPDPLDRGSA
jgi:uncharacterized membrane protein YhaH (DUF805 family)